MIKNKPELEGTNKTVNLILFQEIRLWTFWMAMEVKKLFDYQGELQTLT